MEGSLIVDEPREWRTNVSTRITGKNREVFWRKTRAGSDLGQIASTKRNLERQMSKIPGDVPKETRAPASQVIKAYIPPWTLISVSLF